MTEAEIRAILCDYDIDHVTRRDYIEQPKLRVYTLTRDNFTVVNDRTQGTRLELIGTGYSVNRDLHFLEFRILPETDHATP